MQSWPHELAGVVAKINPANNNNSTQNSDSVDLSKFHAAMFILLLGSVDNTNDFKLQESADASSWSDLSGKAITQLAGTDDNKAAVISVRSDELSSGKRYVRCVNTVGNGTTNITAAVGLGFFPRYGPATDDDLAAVAQIVS